MAGRQGFGYPPGYQLGEDDDRNVDDFDRFVVAEFDDFLFHLFQGPWKPVIVLLLVAITSPYIFVAAITVALILFIAHR